MFYHPNDNRFTLVVKHLTALIALFAMVVLFIYVALGDIQVPQKDSVILVDIKNRVNICLPEDDEFSEESFLDF